MLYFEYTRIICNLKIMGKENQPVPFWYLKKKYRVIHVDVPSIVGHWSELGRDSKAIRDRRVNPKVQKPLPRHTGQEVLLSETEDQERKASQRTKSRAWRRCSVGSRVECRWEIQWERGSTRALDWEGQTAAFAEAHWGHLLWAAS